MNIASNGIRLHVADQGKGAPAIVFLHGWGASTRTWEHVIAALPPGYRTVAIDQRGWGSSDHPASGYSLAELADDTEGAIKALGLERYILVGHSFGGLVMQRFALEYPRDVAGVILLDPMRTDEWPPVNAARHATVARAQRFTAYGSNVARFGITRLAARSHFCRSARLSGFLIRLAGAKGEYLADRLNTEIGKMAPQVRPSIAAHWSAPRFYRGLLAHLSAVPATVTEMHQTDPIRAMPVVVVTPGSSIPIQDMSKFGPQSRQVIAENSQHWIHLDEPDIVLDAIRAMMAAAAAETTTVVGSR